MTLFQRVFYSLLLIFIAILSVSGTIALRNMVHVVLLGMFIWALVEVDKRCCIKPAELWREVPWALRWWIVFLLLFPLWAVEGEVALSELLLHWSESILTWVLAFAAVIILGKNNLSLWALTWASAVPVLLHLTLLPLAMIGIFSNEFGPEDGLSAIWDTLRSPLIHPTSIEYQWRSILRFTGIEPMHGNIGYPATQTIALALGCLTLALRHQSGRGIWAAWILIALCLTSGLIASSRGTVIFSILILAFAGCAALLFRLTPSNMVRGVRNWKKIPGKWTLPLLALTALGLFLWLFLSVVQHDSRWQTMIVKLKVGLNIDRPIVTLCNGLQNEDQELIRRISKMKGEAYEREITDGLLGQDGGRMLLQRVGVQLVWENPRGLDGSRDAYEKIIAKKCGHPPKQLFSHAHNAWVNLALSIGWLGAGLLAWVFVAFAVLGWRALRSGGKDVPLGFSLLLLAVFWLLRGIADAVFQEHYLQMQAIMLLGIGLLVGKEQNGHRQRGVRV